jgi:hypothetical protein
VTNPQTHETFQSTPREYLPFIDWMKFAGIAIIVVGHVAAAPINGLVAPIYPKQLGVAFFIFVMGFSLARETRPCSIVLANRLFDIYLFGAVSAVLISACTYTMFGSLNLSNYLPILGGMNVIFNNFPANPTTWFIGTYLHILIAWIFVFRRIRIHLWILPAVSLGEILVRSLLVPTLGGFVAYMAITNWLTVFLLGIYFGQRPQNRVAQSTILNFVALAFFLVAWHFTVSPFILERSFPFMRLNWRTGPFDGVITSLTVSLVYAITTLLFFRFARTIPAPSLIRFFARNTVIIFIGHMPIFYALAPILNRSGASYTVRSIVYLFACFILLAIVSEYMRNLVLLMKLRSFFMNTLFAKVAAI